MKKFKSFGGRSYHRRSKLPSVGMDIGEILEKVQDRIEGIEVVGKAGGEVVNIRMNGEYKVLEIDIEPSIFEEEDKEMLVDLLTAAFNDAVDKVNEEKKKLLGDFGLGDMNFPSL